MVLDFKKALDFFYRALTHNKKKNQFNKTLLTTTKDNKVNSNANQYSLGVVHCGGTLNALYDWHFTIRIGHCTVVAVGTITCIRGLLGWRVVGASAAIGKLRRRWYAFVALQRRYLRWWWHFGTTHL